MTCSVIGSAPAGRVRVLRIIARLNAGGPAHHVGILSGRLDPAHYETLLLAGHVGPGEASLAEIAQRNGAQLRFVNSLGPELEPLRDARALAELVGVMRRFKPHIIHTHTAKAGIVGRAAACAACGKRSVIVHTYHGHVLEGYFGPIRAGVYRTLERAAARSTDCLIGVSQTTVDDLVRLRIAPRPRFRVIPLGLDLQPFLELSGGEGSGLRDQLGVREGVLATFVGRLVPIKRVDVLLRGVAHAHSLGAAVHLAVVGDGPLRGHLETLARELEISAAVSFLGYRRDLTTIAAAADLGVLASDNEGTPVSLIELAAAANPVVATDVGGVSEVAPPGTGLLAPRGDFASLGEAIARLAGDAGERSAMGLRGRDHVAARYSAERLVADIDDLYRELLRTKSCRTSRVGFPHAAA